MPNKKQLISNTVLLPLLASFQQCYAVTPGSMTYSVTTITPTSIPTLSTTMLITFALFLFFVATKLTKQSASLAKKLSIALAGLIVLSGIGVTLNVVQDAEANSRVLTFNTSATTGQVSLSLNENYAGIFSDYFINSSEQQLTITGITPSSTDGGELLQCGPHPRTNASQTLFIDDEVTTPTTTICTVGLLMNTNEECELHCQIVRVGTHPDNEF